MNAIFDNFSQWIRQNPSSYNDSYVKFLILSGSNSMKLNRKSFSTLFAALLLFLMCIAFFSFAYILLNGGIHENKLATTIGSVASALLVFLAISETLYSAISELWCTKKVSIRNFLLLLIYAVLISFILGMNFGVNISKETNNYPTLSKENQ